MKIRIVSDIHSEFFKPAKEGVEIEDIHTEVIPYLPDEEEMVLVIAGDFCTVDNMQQTIPWIEFLAQRHMAVVYVGGNHEAYHGSRDESIFYWKYIAATISNLYVLENDTIYLPDGNRSVRFIGTTLFTALDGPLDHVFIREMADLDYIKGFGLHEWKVAHELARMYIEQQLALNWEGDTVIVTHHAPSYQSIVGKYKGNAVNCCYASHLDNLVGYSGAAFWFHGHMHDSSAYTLGDTRVICNPYGYRGEYINAHYDPTMIVEV